MFYEKKITPIGDEGHFLLSVHFKKNKIGGECTQESNERLKFPSNI